MRDGGAAWKLRAAKTVTFTAFCSSPVRRARLTEGVSDAEVHAQRGQSPSFDSLRSITSTDTPKRFWILGHGSAFPDLLEDCLHLGCGRFLAAERAKEGGQFLHEFGIIHDVLGNDAAVCGS
jgi:hypothetical protein